MAKILLVEDDSNLREIYGARLEAEGYQIISASDGEEALALAVREHPDLIISDVMMPRISGFDMLDILRSTPETREVKVIVMTALSQEEDRKRGEQLGADRYVVKSQVTLDDVVSMVQEVLATVSQPIPDASTLNAPSAPVAAPQQPATVQVPITQTPDPTPTEPVTSIATDPTPQQPIPVNVTTPQSPDPTYAPTTPIQPTPQPSQDPLDPSDEAQLTKEVEQFVATSPLMNGTAPTPSASTPQNPTPTPEPSQTL